MKIRIELQINGNNHSNVWHSASLIMHPFVVWRLRMAQPAQRWQIVENKKNYSNFHKWVAFCLSTSQSCSWSMAEQNILLPSLSLSVSVSSFLLFSFFFLHLHWTCPCSCVIIVFWHCWNTSHLIQWVEYIVWWKFAGKTTKFFRAVKSSLRNGNVSNVIAHLSSPTGTSVSCIYFPIANFAIIITCSGAVPTMDENVRDTSQVYRKNSFNDCVSVNVCVYAIFRASVIVLVFRSKITFLWIGILVRRSVRGG